MWFAAPRQSSPISLPGWSLWKCCPSLLLGWAMFRIGNHSKEGEVMINFLKFDWKRGIGAYNSFTITSTRSAAMTTNLLWSAWPCLPPCWFRHGKLGSLCGHPIFWKKTRAPLNQKRTLFACPVRLRYTLEHPVSLFSPLVNLILTFYFPH